MGRTMEAGWPFRSTFLWIDIRACQDTNGDGMGDLPGLISRLDHFSEVGVGALVLVGLQPSDFAYGGTMMTEFCSVDSRFGTLLDFDRLVREAHNRQIAILVGWSPFSTHPDHPYFVASRDPSHPKHGELKDYFLWVDDVNSRLPRRWGHWEWDSLRKLYYHTVWQTVDRRWCPEVNLLTPRARAENLRVVKFWLDRDADGFWVDCGVWGGFTTTEAHVKVAREMTDLVHSYPNKWIISEGSKSIEDTIVRDGYDSLFADQARGVPTMKTVYRKPWMGTLVEFFEEQESHGIHEALLSFYDDPQGNQVMNGFQMPHPLDFRDPGEIQKAKLDLAIHEMLPLVPMFRFPQHAGLARVKSRTHVQTFPFLMMWDTSPHFGFSTAAPYIAQNEEGYPDSATVQAQLADPSSFLSCFRDLANLRRASPALQAGDPVPESYGRVPTDDDANCYAFMRRHVATGQAMLIVANLLPEERPYTVHLGRSRKVMSMVGEKRKLRLRLGAPAVGAAAIGADRTVLLKLPAYGFAVFELER